MMNEIMRSAGIWIQVWECSNRRSIKKFARKKYEQEMDKLRQMKKATAGGQMA
ncbi:MAG TPA: hypothetical protein VJ824_12925 [Bacillota bacterium]|nr:hypothetical protein [Bacillota bacterium]